MLIIYSLIRAEESAKYVGLEGDDKWRRCLVGVHPEQRNECGKGTAKPREY